MISDLGIKRLLKIIGFTIFSISIIGYAIFSSKNLIFGVKIKNVNIKDGEQVSEKLLKISGNAKNAVDLTLNGQKIWIDPQGDFKESIVLLPGFNIINLEAKDKFGNSDKKNYQLVHPNR
jgi:hypothetical protein